MFKKPLSRCGMPKHSLAGSRSAGHASGLRHRVGVRRKVFGAAHPHHVYLFANRRSNRIKVLVHDGIGMWLAARRLNQGGSSSGRTLAASPSSRCSRTDSWRAWCLGLPWQRIGQDGVIRII